MEEYKKDDRGRSKAKRLTMNDPHTKVDSSTWTPDAAENAGVKTGARPLVKRLYKKGGKVVGKHEGKDAVKHAGRMPRKAGGRTNTLSPDSLINRDVRTANEAREGTKHIGAFKKGGVAKYGKGGRMPLEGHPYHKKTDAELRYISKDAAEAARSMKGMDSKAENKYLDQMNDAQTVLGHRQRTGNGPESGMKKGGRAHKFGGGMLGNNPVTDQYAANAKAAGPMKKGGKVHKKWGGKSTGVETDFHPSTYGEEKVNYSDKDNEAVSNIAKYGSARGNPTASPDYPERKRGGNVKHNDEAQDKKLMHKVLKPNVFKAKGGKAMHHEDCSCKMCGGGRTMKYGGGGVFSGDSKTKIPGATGGRKAREHGGANMSDDGAMPMASYNFLTGWSNLDKATPDQIAAMKPADRQMALAAQGPSRGVMPAHRAAPRPMIGSGRGVSGPTADQMNPPTRMGGTPATGTMAPRTQNYSMPGVHMGGPGEPAIVFGGSKADQNYNLAGNPDLNTPSVDEMRQYDARGGRAQHAKGGRTKAGKTTINIVMGGHGQQPQNMPDAPVMPPKPPMGVPVPPPQMAGGAPMGAGAPPMPPQMPPQMPGRATGGRTGKMVGGSLGNAQGFGQPSMGGYGQVQQPMMGGVGQQGMMPRKSGGRTNYPIDTGAGGANARLEKIDAYGLKPSKRK